MCVLVADLLSLVIWSTRLQYLLDRMIVIGDPHVTGLISASQFSQMKHLQTLNSHVTITNN